MLPRRTSKKQTETASRGKAGDETESSNEGKTGSNTKGETRGSSEGSTRGSRGSRDQRPLTTTDNLRPSFYNMNASTSPLTFRSKAYYVSKEKCNNSELFEGPGPATVCTPYHTAYVKLSVVESRLGTKLRYTNSSVNKKNSLNVRKWMLRYTNSSIINKTSLIVRKWLLKHCFAFIIQTNTESSLDTKFRYTKSSLINKPSLNVRKITLKHCFALVIRTHTEFRLVSKLRYTSKSVISKTSLYARKTILKHCFVKIIHTSLHNEIENVVSSYLKCTKSIVVKIHNILEIKHHKPPFSKAMLHSAPQIKLWGGEGLEKLRKNHLLSNTSPKHSKNYTREKNQMLKTHSSHKKKYIDKTHNCMPSCKYNRAIWNSLYRKFIQKFGPQSICTQILSMFSQNTPSQLNARPHIKNQKNSFYKSTKSITNKYKYILCTYTVDTSSHVPRTPFLTLYPIKTDKKHVYVKRNFRMLTQILVMPRMSLRNTNSSSSRYKEKLLALESDPDIDMFVTQKRTSSSSQATLTQKKAKGKPNVGSTRPPFWLGFQAMNWTNRGKGLPKDSHLPIITLVTNGIREKEARECLSTTPSFPFVIQEEWPNSKEDGKSGQHFNLTQIPSDVEVDKFGFSFDY